MGSGDVEGDGYFLTTFTRQINQKDSGGRDGGKRGPGTLVPVGNSARNKRACQTFDNIGHLPDSFDGDQRSLLQQHHDSVDHHSTKYQEP